MDEFVKKTNFIFAEKKVNILFSVVIIHQKNFVTHLFSGFSLFLQGRLQVIFARYFIILSFNG